MASMWLTLVHAEHTPLREFTLRALRRINLRKESGLEVSQHTTAHAGGCALKPVVICPSRKSLDSIQTLALQLG